MADFARRGALDAQCIILGRKRKEGDFLKGVENSIIFCFKLQCNKTLNFVRFRFMPKDEYIKLTFLLTIVSNSINYPKITFSEGNVTLIWHFKMFKDIYSFVQCCIVRNVGDTFTDSLQNNVSIIVFRIERANIYRFLDIIV